MSASGLRLLDANVVIALTTAHEHRVAAEAWLSNVERFALCPITEGALVRFLIRAGVDGSTVQAVLNGFHEHPRCSFLGDTLSYRKVPLAAIRGHREVTDEYLVTLARDHDARLATFDHGLSVRHPEAIELIPQVQS